MIFGPNNLKYLQEGAIGRYNKNGIFLDADIDPSETRNYKNKAAYFKVHTEKLSKNLDPIRIPFDYNKKGDLNYFDHYNDAAPSSKEGWLTKEEAEALNKFLDMPSKHDANKTNWEYMIAEFNRTVRADQKISTDLKRPDYTDLPTVKHKGKKRG